MRRKVYWTDTNSMVGEGALMRMDMNGSNVEVLLQKLHWPRALTIDYGRELLMQNNLIDPLLVLKQIFDHSLCAIYPSD